MDTQGAERLVKMAAQLYDMRDRMRRLLGDKYKPRMQAIGAMLTELARQANRDTLETAIDIAKRRQYVGMDLWLLMAAAVELAEPSALCLPSS